MSGRQAKTGRQERRAIDKLRDASEPREQIGQLEGADLRRVVKAKRAADLAEKATGAARQWLAQAEVAEMQAKAAWNFLVTDLAEQQGVDPALLRVGMDGSVWRVVAPDVQGSPKSRARRAV